MACPVVFTFTARDDLQSIIRYIAQDSPVRAGQFAAALEASVLKLGDYPNLGRSIRDAELPECREIIVGSYRVIYRQQSDPECVVVLRFWHSARGTPWVTFSDP